MGSCTVVFGGTGFRLTVALEYVGGCNPDAEDAFLQYIGQEPSF
jgi:hypothetical protein